MQDDLYNGRKMVVAVFYVTHQKLPTLLEVSQGVRYERIFKTIFPSAYCGMFIS